MAARIVRKVATIKAMAVRGNRNAVHQGVNRVAKKFEAGNQSYLKQIGGEFFAQDAGMIEDDFPGPSVDERTSVEVFNATDPQEP